MVSLLACLVADQPAFKKAQCKKKKKKRRYHWPVLNNVDK